MIPRRTALKALLALPFAPSLITEARLAVITGFAEYIRSNGMAHMRQMIYESDKFTKLVGPHPRPGQSVGDWQRGGSYEVD